MVLRCMSEQKTFFFVFFISIYLFYYYFLVKNTHEILKEKILHAMKHKFVLENDNFSFHRWKPIWKFF